MFGKRNFLRRRASPPRQENDSGSAYAYGWNGGRMRPDHAAAPDLETTTTRTYSRSSFESDSSQRTIELPDRPAFAASSRDSAVSEIRGLVDLFEQVLRPTKRPDLSYLSTESSLFSGSGRHSIGGFREPRNGLESLNLDDLLISDLGRFKDTTKRRYKVHQKWTALHSSAANGKLAQVTVLISRKVDVDAREDDGWSPLILAAQNGHVDVVRTLINSGANVNHAGDEGATALRQASQNGHIEIVELLLSHNADPNKITDSNTTALSAAIAGSINPKRIKADMIRIVAALLRGGARTDFRDEDGDPPLFYACLMSELEIARLLIAHGADVNTCNKKGHNALSLAAYSTNAAIVELLLQNHAKINHRESDDWTPLHLCVQNLKDETLKVVKLLVKAGADVNARTNNNATPLHIAAQVGDLAIIRFLIESKAIVNARTTSGRTPLLQAAANNHLDAVELLIKSGVDVNVATDKEGLTILHIAIVRNDVDMVERLLKLKADPNAKAFDQTSPLGLASNLDDDRIFLLLLDHGADPS